MPKEVALNDLYGVVGDDGKVTDLAIDGQRFNLVSSKTNPITGVVENLFAGSRNVVTDLGLGAGGGSSALIPSGGDDTAAIQSHIDTMAAAGKPVEFGPGDFRITSRIELRSSSLVDKWSGQGIGLSLRGAGPGNTRFMCSQPATDAAFFMSAPTAAGIGNRNYMFEFDGFSMHRCTSGVSQIAQGSTSGKGIEIAPEVAAGEVFAFGRANRLYFDGFDYPLTLSDVTGFEIDNTWFHEFLTAIRAGYNNDIITIRHCMFGSEQFGVSYRNNAIAYQNGYLDGFHAAAANDDCVVFESCWFMKIGKAFENAADIGIKGLRFDKCYFEDVRQYVHALGTTGQMNLEMRGNKFSKHTANDVTQTDPTVAGYMAKIQFDGTVTVTNGVQPYVTMEDNVADYVAGANAWISLNNRLGRVFWKNNYMRSSAAFGHVRCIRSGYATWRTLPNDGLGQWVLGDTDMGGVGILSGEPVQVAATISAASTYNISTLSGNHFLLTLPDGDCTIESLAYSGTPPSHLVSANTKVKVTLIVPASVTGTRTITWGSSLKMNAGTLTFTAAEQGKRTTIILEGYSNSGNALQLASRDPAFV